MNPETQYTIMIQEHYLPAFSTLENRRKALFDQIDNYENKRW